LEIFKNIYVKRRKTVANFVRQNILFEIEISNMMQKKDAQNYIKTSIFAQFQHLHSLRSSTVSRGFVFPPIDVGRTENKGSGQKHRLESPLPRGILLHSGDAFLSTFAWRAA
jgi:hypothetical protein